MIKLLALLWLSPLSQADLGSPSTIDELYQRLKSAGAKSKAEVLAALPDDMKSNYVLIRESHSRQQGTPDLPRVLHFMKNGELIASSSGHNPQDDFASNDLEVMALDRAAGKWQMAMIHFDGKTLSEPAMNPRMCLACHGENPRPIWGEYHNWPTAYGGDPVNGTETMGKQEGEDFQKFLTKAKTHEGYRHLVQSVSPYGFRLPNSVYDYPNTVFGSRIGMRQVEAIASRLSKSPQFARLRLALVAAARSNCPDRFAFEAWISQLYAERVASDADFAKRWENSAPQRTYTKILRLLGSDPAADFDLTILPRGSFPEPSEEEAVSWNIGADYMISAVALLVFRDAWQNDSQLQNIFALRGAALAKAYERVFTSSEALRELDSEETSGAYADTVFLLADGNIFGPVLASPARNQFCDYLTQVR